MNLEKAEQLVGVDMDILQRKAVIYGMKNDIRNGLLTANQMKLIDPSEYKGYQIAFKLLIQAKRLETAERELKRAERFASPTMDFYFDSMSLELEKYLEDQNKAHFHSVLALIEKALTTLKPEIKDVMKRYIDAAEINLQLENPDQVIHCLNAVQSPAEAYNNGFEVEEKIFDSVELTEYDVEVMIEEDRVRIEEEFGEYGLEEMAESIELDEDGNREYFTEIDDEEETEDVSAYRLAETENVEYSADNTDQINRLYIGAYTLKRDFNKVIEYARVLQASESIQNSYVGKYAEANAMKQLGAPEATEKYRELIKYFRNAMIKDPTDLAAVTFRIQCYADIEEYDEAEQLCNLLTSEIKEPLLEKIREARAGGADIEIIS